MFDDLKEWLFGFVKSRNFVLIAIFTDVTGLDDVKSEIGKVKIIYDLNGRAVENPTNGIYVVNGKKIRVK